MNKTVILSIAAIAVISFTGCGNKSGNDEGAKSAVTETMDKAKDATAKVAEKTKEAAAATTEAVKEGANKAVEATKESANKAVEATKEAANNVANKAKEAATATTNAVKEGANKAKEAVAGGNAKGKEIFAKCVSCHGQDGKTKALGKSEIIAGQSVADLEKKISEYKAGSRNVAGMGTLMQGQVSSLSDDDIKAVAEYISSLK
jgi:cytochrome c553